MPRKKRNRSHTRTNMRQAQNEIPREQIMEAAKSHPMVSIKVLRTSGNGMWSTIKGNPFAMDTIKLVDVDAWLQEQFGGGQYRVEARVAHDPTQVLEMIPLFMVKVEGVPKVSELPTDHHKQRTQDLPLDPSGNVNTGNLRPRDYMSNTPDAIAMSVLQNREQELTEERKLREQERMASDKRLGDMQKQLLDMQKTVATAESRREIAALEAKLEAVVQRASTAAVVPPKEKIDWVGMAPILAPTITAVAGIAVAVIESGKARAQAADERAQKHTELLVTTMAGNKPADPLAGIVSLLGIAIPAATPLIKGFLEARSPDKMGELVSTMADNNLSQMSMMKQLLDPILQQEDNPLVTFLQQGMNSLMEVAQHMVKATAPAQPQQTARVNAGPARVISNGNGNGQHAPEGDEATANYFVNLIMAAPNVPAEFKTPEWQEILRDMHAFEPAEDVARAIATHLAAQSDAKTLPTFLLPIFKEDSVAPSQVLGQFLAGLPVAAINAQYVNDVLSSFDALFSEDPAAQVVA